MITGRQWATGRGLGPLAVVGFLGLAFGGLFTGRGIVNDDYPAVYLRIHQYAAEFATSHLPQALPDVLLGGGTAFPRFYPPLAYYIGAGTYGLLGDIVWAGHLTAFSSILASALTMTWAAGRLGAGRWLACIAGLAYATLPYRFTNVLVRGALAESWALVWLPLVFVAGFGFARGTVPGRWLAMSIALLLLTHTGLALWAIPILLATALMAARPERLRSAVTGYGIWGAVGLGLSAWYLLPMLHYLPEVWASEPELMWATPADFLRWRVPWDAVIGLTAVSGALPYPMALSVGLPSLTLPVALLLQVRRPAVPASDRRVGLSLAIAGLVVLLIIVYPHALVVWLPQRLLYLQFPYRLLGVAGALIVLATALVLRRAARDDNPGPLSVVWLVLVVFGAGLETFRPTPAGTLDQSALLNALGSYERGLTAKAEYLPKGADRDGIVRRIRDTRATLHRGALAMYDTTNQLIVALESAAPTTVVLPRVYYDFLRVVDESGRELPGTAVDGLLAVRVQPGRVTLSVERRLPWPLRLGILCSALSLLLMFLAGMRRKGVGCHAPANGAPPKDSPASRSRWPGGPT